MSRTPARVVFNDVYILTWLKRKLFVGRLLVGLTGGIATGKTAVANMFEGLGAKTIDYDILVRQIQAPGEAAYQDIVSFFGPSVLAEDQTLNRGKLREIVFQDSEKLKKLNGFIHPRLNTHFYNQVENFVKNDPNAIIQAVVPLLIETNMQSMFDCLVMVYAPQSIQLKRIMERDKNSEALAQSIIDAQMSVEEKKNKCDFVIDNSKSLEITSKQVSDVWHQLKKIQTQIAINGQLG